MPQARLPDINAAFTKHRNEIITALKSGNYDAVLGSLYSLNALLPDTVYTKDDVPEGQPEKEGHLKYRVIMSDIEYNKLAKPTITLFCYHCDPELTNGHIYEDVRFYDILMSFDHQQLTQKMYDRVWKCPKCKKNNRLARTHREDLIAETKLKEPYYLGVVPKPPQRHNGLMDRTKYHNKMKQWAETYLAELENKMALFRDDYWKKGGEEDAEVDLDIDGGEEEYETD